MRDEIRTRGGRLLVWARRGTETVAHVFDADLATFSLPQESLCGLPVQRVWQTEMGERCKTCSRLLRDLLKVSQKHQTNEKEQT